MEYPVILEFLRFALGAERAVRITTTDGQTLLGVPTSVDEHPSALEVYLHPVGDDDTEIALGLSQIARVEFD